MEKILLFLPAVVHTLATLCLNLISGALIPLWHIWNGLFWLSGWLMSRGKVWGCLPGLVPAVSVILLNTEKPLGIESVVGALWLFYYISCGFFVHKFRKKTGKNP